MGLVRGMLSLPLSGPMKGTLWVARKVHDTALQEQNNPATLRKTLQMLETQLLAGDIDEDEYDAAETEILLRLKALQ